MRRPGTYLVLALLVAAGCSFDTAGPGFSGSVTPATDGSAFDAVKTDIGPKPDTGVPTDGPLNKDKQPPPDQAPPADKGLLCGGKLYLCNGDKSQVCKDDSYIPYETCVMGCDKASGRCNKFKTLNNAGAYLGDSGKWTVSGIVTLDTTNGTFNPAQLTTEVKVHLGTNLRVLTMATMDVAAKGVLKVTGDLPLLIAAKDSIIVTGAIDVSAVGAVPGPAGAAGGGKGKDGSGCGGGAKSDGLSGVGGNGGSHGGKGGKGGNTAPTVACSVACASPMVGGSGGGDGDGREGNGGAGGGALQLTAGKAITISGTINAGGGGGRRGMKPDFAYDIITGNGGGGGSGGSIILEAPEIKVDGVVAANGGGGGGSASVTVNHGGHGQDGLASTKAAKGGAEGVALLAGAGGDGSSETALDGDDSKLGGLTGGGGGGGAGRVCIRSKTKLYSGKGSISPAPGSGAGALQKLVVVAP